MITTRMPTGPPCTTPPFFSSKAPAHTSPTPVTTSLDPLHGAKLIIAQCEVIHSGTTVEELSFRTLLKAPRIGQCPRASSKGTPVPYPISHSPLRHQSDRNIQLTPHTHNSDLQLSLSPSYTHTHTHTKTYKSDTLTKTHKKDPPSTHTQHGNAQPRYTHSVTDSRPTHMTVDTRTEARCSHTHPYAQGRGTQYGDTLILGHVLHFLYVTRERKGAPNVSRPMSPHLQGLPRAC